MFLSGQFDCTISLELAHLEQSIFAGGPLAVHALFANELACMYALECLYYFSHFRMQLVAHEFGKTIQCHWERVFV